MGGGTTDTASEYGQRRAGAVSRVDVVQGSGGNGVSHDARNGVKLTAVAGSGQTGILN